MNDEEHRLALPQGTRIRDFEFHRVLGHGGFGITYLGWNMALDIPVAIKEYLPADLATREQDLSVVPQTTQAASDFQWGLERFLDEARTLARFQHPNIVRVHHFFEAHSTAYIAMDYVEGEDLSAYLTRKGPLREAELKGILDPLLSALEVVHRADFLHRDIKPGNIVLRDSDGSPVLLDFGAARQAIGAKSRSVTSIVTPGYAPIEQYSSRGRQGAWTDIYALGGVCYRALTGQVPDDATDRVRHDPLVPVSERCAGQASPAFLSAIDAALAVDEEDRPPSVGAWRAALGADAADVQERAALEQPRREAQAEQQRREQQREERQRQEELERVEPAAPPSAPQKQPSYKRLAVVLGVVIALLVGVGLYVDHVEQVALEKQRQADQAAEAERVAAEQAEQQRQADQAAEAERVAAEQAEQQRQADQAAEAERVAAEQAEQQRQADQAAEAERVAAEQAEQQRQADQAAEAARLAAEQAEQQRQADQAAEAARLAAEQAEVVSLPGGASMAFVWIAPGVFQMGSPASEAGRRDNEGPVHEVAIGEGFWLGKYEVTQGQWESVLGDRPWSGKWGVVENSSHPAVYISWDAVQRFIGRLNEAAGASLYRLPSEAEWEYACRAGSRTRWSFGDDERQLTDYAWYDANAWDVGERYTHAVGLKRPNPWGLYDMHGNVSEWVQDRYSKRYYNSSPRVDPRGPSSGADRVVQGGSFYSSAQAARSAFRYGLSPDARYATVGVRLLRIR